MEAFFLPVGAHRRFCLLHSPEEPARGGNAIVYVHPFAEEMNKSRRMASLQARALAAAGWSVLQMDLAGCGDSGGEFADATWRDWRDDACAAWAWLRERTGRSPWLWGLRAGGLLVADAASRLDGVPGVLYWQPVLSGRQHLQQFLRLRIAAQVFGSNSADRVDTRALWAQLHGGESVEVAGYTVSPGLALDMATAELMPPPVGARVEWIEVAASEAADVSPAARLRIDDWRARGVAVQARTVVGEPFWQTQEITECPALIAQTLSALEAHA